MLKSITFVLVCISLVVGLPTGAPGCEYPCDQMSSSQSGTGGFQIQIFQTGTTTVPTILMPGVSYDVKLSNAGSYAGFLLIALDSASANIAGPSVGTFSFAGANDNSDLQLVVSCGGVTHKEARSGSPRTSDFFTWTSPNSFSSGTVTFQMVGVFTAANWFGQTNNILLSLPSNTTAVATSTSSSSTGSTGTSTSTTGKSSSTKQVVEWISIALLLILNFLL